MISDISTLMIFKFGEKQWIDKILAGELSFSCAGAFINQAKRTGNTIQGDLYEAVFARLKSNDSKILEMKNKLGRDLEIIPDGQYCYLRRKSAKFKPIFCFYSLKAIDLINEGEVKTEGYNLIRHDFDNRMYSGFASNIGNPLVREEFQFRQLFIQTQSFVNRINIAYKNNGIGFKMGNVNYELFKNETFFIDPTDSYDELFYKSPEYEYQLEGRIILTDIKLGSTSKRYLYKVIPFKDEEYKLSQVPVCMKFDTIVEKRK